MTEPSHATRFRIRTLEQILTEATASYWERRATVLDDAAPRPDDYPGQATPAQLATRAEALHQTAEACRMHAALIRSTGLHGVARMAWEALAQAEHAARTGTEPPDQLDAWAEARHQGDA